MSIIFEERPSDSPYVDRVTHGHTVADGAAIRPAECHWHLVLVNHPGGRQALVVGPWTTAGPVSWAAGAEILWIRFKLGTFMPHLAPRELRDRETPLPVAARGAFRLHGAAWPFPDYENVDTFVARLAREDVLVRDPVVADVLQERPVDVAPRTLRHRFLRVTGLSQTHIRQFARARQAEALLRQGTAILDAVDDLGYYDQPHLTRALKRFVGHTPAQLAAGQDPA